MRLAVLFLASAVSWRTEAESAARKLAQIQAGRSQRGAIVQFSIREINAYAQSRIPIYAPEGVRDAKLVLGPGTVTGTAVVDFLKLRHAAGTETNWVISRLIEGQRPVRITAHVQSSRGTATVFVDRVEISGVAVAGTPLDMLIETFLRPMFPDAKINQPFRLRYGVDHLAVMPSGLQVFVRK
jgi:hypothetical protein